MHWRKVSIVGDQQKVGTLVQDALDTLEIRRRSPASIVQRIPTTGAANAKIQFGVVE
jgi:hypothetical protein